MEAAYKSMSMKAPIPTPPPYSHYICSDGNPVYEMYALPDNVNTETYMMQGTELYTRLASPTFENIEAMVSEGAEYVYDPNMYYPAASSYGYYYTGVETPSEWDGNRAVFGVDGADVNYMGAQTESLPYVYYAPGCEYGETPYNPYNPYIPGAMIGVDGSSVGTQSYYVSPYLDPVSSSNYFPVLVQSGQNIVASSAMDTISDVGPSTTHRVSDSSGRRAHPSTPTTFSTNPLKAAPSQANVVSGAAQGSKINTGTTKHPIHNRSNGSGHGLVSHLLPSANTRGSLHSEKLLQETNHVKFSYPVGGGLLDHGSSANSQGVLTDPWSNYYGGAFNDWNGSHDPLNEQIRGPRTNKSKNQITVKAYTTKAGERNAEGHIVISADQYNKGDFPLDYPYAKFYVIKSYSEDDVHKSIKYNVWSSTPNGNKKLNSAYEDAQKIAAGKPRGCPIFLFFSVNASGQFCGVAEMVGPVDFDNDMDFWQQDKWSGSFLVKWHIIKDVPNPAFRLIILENNEHKPVSNSRDTQEIFRKPGVEMLKVFKNFSAKTSLLDDFMYYEHRQRIMHEERARHQRAHGHSRPSHPPQKLHLLVDKPRKDDEMNAWVEKGAQHQPNKGIASESGGGTAAEKVSAVGGLDKSDATGTKQSHSEAKPSDVVASLKIGSLSINPKQTEQNPAAPASSSVTAANLKTAAGPANIVTVGSMPIKVDGVKKSSGMLSIGTIALDPEALRKMGGLMKGDPQK